MLHTSIGIDRPATWGRPTGTSMTAAVIPSALRVATTSRGTLNIDYPRTSFAYKGNAF